MIRVGIIGASATARWAAEAHVPAIKAVDGLELEAVATSRQETADASAAQHGARLAFADARALIEHPDVDLVSICVRVPLHAEMVQAAIAAGKHVLCEWPLAIDSAEADVLVEASGHSSAVHAVGLQARRAPAVRLARELILSGEIGAVQSAWLSVAAGAPGGARVPAAIAWGAAREAGMNVLTVPGGHALDALCFCVGEFAELSATTAILNSPATVIETDEQLVPTSPDHVAISGVSRDRAVIAALVRGGQAAEVGATIEIRGASGLIRIDASGRHLQNSPLTLRVARGNAGLSPVEIPEAMLAGLSSSVRGTPAENVAATYESVRDAITIGTPVAADFRAAAARHALLGAIETAAETGTRQDFPRAVPR